MGNPFSKYVKVELYKWSSSEFPQEYALIYTSLDDEFRTSTLRVSVNTDVVLCRHADNMCKHHPARFHMKVTAVRDNNGDCKFKEVIIVENGSGPNSAVVDNYACLRYGCEDESGEFTVKSKDQNLDRVNLEKTYWSFCHSYDIGIRRQLKYFVSIQCNKVTGLCVGFSGPLMYKGVVFEDELGLHSKCEVLGKPPKALIAKVESEFEGKLYIIFQRGKGDQNGETLPSAQATRLTNNINTGGQAKGLNNNIGGYTQGTCVALQVNNSISYCIPKH
ncbi:hypothetical protein CR513_56322, partial [Mucuna pruriens]